MKTRFILPLAAFALLAIMFAIGVSRAPQNSVLRSVLIGKPAPEFKLPSLTSPGTLVSSKDFAGKPYMINVWATWCVECRVEHQSLMQIQSLGHIEIVGLNWRDEEPLALEWLAKLGNPYTAVAVDKEGRTVIDYGVYGAPETFLVDAKGIVVHRHVGPLSFEVWKRDFQPLLGGTPAGPT